MLAGSLMPAARVTEDLLSVDSDIERSVSTDCARGSRRHSDDLRDCSHSAASGNCESGNVATELVREDLVPEPSLTRRCDGGVAAGTASPGAVADTATPSTGAAAETTPLPLPAWDTAPFAEKTGLRVSPSRLASGLLSPPLSPSPIPSAVAFSAVPVEAEEASPAPERRPLRRDF